VTLTIDPDGANAMQQVVDFFEERGRGWGARRDIMERVTFGISQAFETIHDVCEAHGPIRIDANFDEFNVEVVISYRGELIELPDRRPSDKEIMESEAGHRRLAGFMLRRNADRVAASRKGEESVVQFHFDH
jgi:NCS2 family nucleobase:cation symporter-2